MSAVTNALNFGLGPLQEALSAMTQELVAYVPAGVTAFVRYGVKLAQEALRKVWEAFGHSQQEEIKQETQTWFNDLLEKKSVASGLLERLYQSEHLKELVVAQITGTKVTDVSAFKRAADGLDELSARYAKIIRTLEWVMRGVGWAKSLLLSVSPWGPATAYCVYGGVLGYSVYAGGDYLDAERFDNKWLNHVVGLRAIVQRELGP
jgi:hypothetical protein